MDVGNGLREKPALPQTELGLGTKLGEKLVFCLSEFCITLQPSHSIHEQVLRVSARTSLWEKLETPHHLIKLTDAIQLVKRGTAHQQERDAPV